MSHRLDGQRTLVTGAGRGIGRAIAERYAAEGARVALLDRAKDRVEDAAAAIGEAAIALAADVRETAEVEAAVGAASDAFDGLDAVVNNAGVIVRADLLETSDAEMDAVIDVNLKGMMRVARAAVPALQRSAGTLINVSSQLGEVGVEDASVYCASKGGINALTRQLAVQYASDGVTVNALAPGVVETPLNEAVRAEDPDWITAQRARIPLDRLATTDDIVGPAVFLASDEAAYVTGHVLVVDGGWLAR